MWGGGEVGSRGRRRRRDLGTHRRGARAGWAASAGPARSAPRRSCSSRSQRCPGAEPALPRPPAAARPPTTPRRPPPGAPLPPRRPPGRSPGRRASPEAWRSHSLGRSRGSTETFGGGVRGRGRGSHGFSCDRRCHSNRTHGGDPGGRRGGQAGPPDPAQHLSPPASRQTTPVLGEKLSPPPSLHCSVEFSALHYPQLNPPTLLKLRLAYSLPGYLLKRIV